MTRIGVQHLILAIGIVATGAPPALAQLSTDPAYSLAGLVNAASQIPGPLAPNAIMTLYGANLSFTTHAAVAADLDHGALPIALDGVHVFVKNIECGLYFVSPGQINFLVPLEIALTTAATVPLIVVRQNLVGPVIQVPVKNIAPGFFEYPGGSALAVHLNGTVITEAAPAKRSEIIVLYAAGLGTTNPATESRKLATTAASISQFSQLQVLLDDAPVPHANILYAGLAPGFAGLYQVNLQLPAALTANPQIRITLGTETSSFTTRLFLK